MKKKLFIILNMLLCASFTSCSFTSCSSKECLHERTDCYKEYISQCYYYNVYYCLDCSQIFNKVLQAKHTLNTTALIEEDSGDAFYTCQFCDYTKYVDSDYTRVKLIIEAPSKIDYYPQIKLHKDSRFYGKWKFKFLKIVGQDYYLQRVDVTDISGYTFSPDIMWFNNHGKSWYEGYEVFGYNKGLCLNDISIGSTLEFSTQYPAYDIAEIKFTFIESLQD